MDLKDNNSADELRLGILKTLHGLKDGTPEPGATDPMLCKSLDVSENDLKTALKWLRNRKLIAVKDDRNTVTDAGVAHLFDSKPAAAPAKDLAEKK